MFRVSQLQHTATRYNSLQHTVAVVVVTVYTRVQSRTLQHSASTLQHTAAHCNTLQQTAALCSTLQQSQHCIALYNTVGVVTMETRAWSESIATHCNMLQHTTTHCNTLQHTATHCNTLQYSYSWCSHYRDLRPDSVNCNALQYPATHCNTLQHIATPYNTQLNTATHSNTLQHSWCSHCGDTCLECPGLYGCSIPEGQAK